MQYRNFNLARARVVHKVGRATTNKRRSRAALSALRVPCAPSEASVCTELLAYVNHTTTKALQPFQQHAVTTSQSTQSTWARTCYVWKEELANDACAMPPNATEGFCFCRGSLISGLKRTPSPRLPFQERVEDPPPDRARPPGLRNRLAKSGQQFATLKVKPKSTQKSVNFRRSKRGTFCGSPIVGVWQTKNEFTSSIYCDQQPWRWNCEFGDKLEKSQNDEPCFEPLPLSRRHKTSPVSGLLDPIGGCDLCVFPKPETEK